MRVAQLLRQSCHSLLLHRLRALLGSLGVLLGVAAVVAMGAIAEGARQKAVAQIAQLGAHTIIVRGANAIALEKLEVALPTLAGLAPVLESSEALATTPAYAQVRRLRIGAGRFLCESDLRGREHVCVVGAECGLHLGETVRLGDSAYTVVGRLAPLHWEKADQPALVTRNLNSAIFTPLARTTPPNEILMQVREASEIERTARAVRRLVGEEAEIIVPHTLLAQAQATQRTFALVLGSIAAISLVVGGIGIANIMLATVSERRREIGIRRALGATRADIALQFLCETGLLTLLGGVFGLLAGGAIAAAVAHFAGWPIAIGPGIAIIAIITSIATGLFAGITPALRAARENPVSALALT